MLNFPRRCISAKDQVQTGVQFTDEKEALQACSRGKMTAIELRRRLGGASYGEVRQRLGEARLPLPRAPQAGREAAIARAHRWMFPSDAPRS